MPIGHVAVAGEHHPDLTGFGDRLAIVRGEP